MGFGFDAEGSPLHPPVQRADLLFPLEEKCMQRRPALRTGLLPSQCSFLLLSLRSLHAWLRVPALYRQVKPVVRSP